MNALEIGIVGVILVIMIITYAEHEDNKIDDCHNYYSIWSGDTEHNRWNTSNKKARWINGDCFWLQENGDYKYIPDPKEEFKNGD